MIPANAPTYVTTPTTPPKRATIDAYTSRVMLGVEPGMPAYVTLDGTWGDPEYGPGGTTVELRTIAGKRRADFTLTKDAAFPLPVGTDHVELKVVDATPGMELTLKVYEEPPRSTVRHADRPAGDTQPAIVPIIPVPAPPPVRAVEPTISPASPPPRRLRGRRGGRNRSQYHGDEQRTAVDLD